MSIEWLTLKDICATSNVISKLYDALILSQFESKFSFKFYSILKRWNEPETRTLLLDKKRKFWSKTILNLFSGGKPFVYNEHDVKT